MAHLLLPTDFSDASMHAARYAAELFGRVGHRYTVFHAYVDVNVVDPSMAMATPDLIADAEKNLLEFTDRFERTTRVEGVARAFVCGPLVPMLNGFARDHQVDVVAVGRSGGGGAFLFGSNTVDLVKRSEVPVLVVPQEATPSRIHRILLADDHDEVGVRDLAALRMIASGTRAHVVVAHVETEGAEQVSWSRSIYEVALKDVPHSFSTLSASDPVSGLERLAVKEQVDMIAVLHRHVGFFGRLFHASTAKELSQGTDLPLLVLEQRA